MVVSGRADPTRRTPWAWLAAICLLSVVGKLGLAVASGVWGAPRVWEYETIAVNLVEGRGYRSEFLGQPYRSEVQPVYPVLCAFIYRLFGHRYAAVQGVQILLATVLCLVVYGIGRRLFSVRVGLWSAALAAAHPGLSYYAVANLHVLPLDALLCALVVWSFVRIADAPGLRPCAVGGLLLGLAVLSRASVLAFVPLGCWWLWSGLRHVVDGGWAARRLAVMVVAAGIVVSPWLARTYALHSRPFYFLSTVGSGLWTGNNPHATGSTLARDGAPIRYTAPPEFLEQLFRLPEVEQDALFRRTALAYMSAHPARTARLFLEKLRNFWWFSPQSGRWYPRAWFTAYRAWYAAVLVLVVVGLWSAWRTGTGMRVAVIPLFALLISLCQSVFYVEGRHRWEIEALLLVPAAAGWCLVLAWASRRRAGMSGPASEAGITHEVSHA